LTVTKGDHAMKRLLSRWTAAAAAIFALTGAAAAQEFPSRPITLVVPFAAGGPSDAIARSVAQSMGSTLKQQVVIENVAGAGGTTGAARVAKAEPDGHTLLIHHVALPAGASLYKNLAYDTATAFEPVGLVNTGPMVLVSKKDFAAKNAKDLFAHLKANGDKVPGRDRRGRLELAYLRHSPRPVPRLQTEFRRLSRAPARP
jgi:tripartite-type tricarboxylate transporter receptor subunit TctC